MNINVLRLSSMKICKCENMSFIKLFSEKAEQGYKASSFEKGAHAANISQEQDTISTQIAQNVQASLEGGKSESSIVQLTGRDHTVADGLNAKIDNLASGANAGANVQNNVTISTLEDNVEAAQGRFLADLDKTQATVSKLLEQAADQVELGFQAAPQASNADTGSIALGDVNNMLSKNLSPEDEALLAEQAVKMLLPLRDANGNVIEAPQIANNFDHDTLEKMKPVEVLKLLKDVMKPAEQHQEMKDFEAMKEKLQTLSAGHDVHKNLDHTILASDVDSADIDVNDVEARMAELCEYKVCPLAVQCSVFPPVQHVENDVIAMDLSFNDVWNSLDLDQISDLTVEFNPPELAEQKVQTMGSNA